MKGQSPVLRKMAVLLGILIVSHAGNCFAAASPEKIPAQDFAAQRHRAWMLLQSLVGTKYRTPTFIDWYSEAETFAAAEPSPDATRMPFPGLPIGAGVAPERRVQHFADAPVITFVHYDRLAYRHIREHQLYRETRLQEIARDGDIDPAFAGMKTIPLLPKGAQILMSAWWPVAAATPTPLPVWDPQYAHDKDSAIDYPSWRRIVAIATSGPVTSLSFAGHEFPAPPTASPQRFFRRTVDTALAATLESDPGTRKAAMLVLGRPVQAGDSLVLLAFHLLTTDGDKGIWSTWWWHDRPTERRFGNDRPRQIKGPWKNYLMDVTTDDVLPREADGSPRICFNPWFEARFPGGGEANGARSNCVNCHTRASYPKTAFLPIRRGAPDKSGDPAFAPGRVRTGLVWSLANPAQAGD
jgi:hypothetical protein